MSFYPLWGYVILSYTISEQKLFHNFSKTLFGVLKFIDYELKQILHENKSKTYQEQVERNPCKQIFLRTTNTVCFFAMARLNQWCSVFRRFVTMADVTCCDVQRHGIARQF